MNKKILGIFVSLLVVALLATPALAVPTKGQKAAVTVYMVRDRSWEPPEVFDPVNTGPVIHNHEFMKYDITIKFEDGSDDLL